MTLRYDDLPTTDGDEAVAWQKDHEPIITVRVWLGPEGQTMTNVAWAPELRGIDEAVCMPLEEMSLTMKAIHRMVHKVEVAIGNVAVHILGAGGMGRAS